MKSLKRTPEEIARFEERKAYIDRVVEKLMAEVKQRERARERQERHNSKG